MIDQIKAGRELAWKRRSGWLAGRALDVFYFFIFLFAGYAKGVRARLARRALGGVGAARPRGGRAGGRSRSSVGCDVGAVREGGRSRSSAGWVGRRECVCAARAVVRFTPPLSERLDGWMDASRRRRRCARAAWPGCFLVHQRIA